MLDFGFAGTITGIPAEKGPFPGIWLNVKKPHKTAKYLTEAPDKALLPLPKSQKIRLFRGMGNANILGTDFPRGIGVKKLLFLTLIVLLALPLACDSRVFNQPVSPLLAPTNTPTPAWSYPTYYPTATATP